MTDINAGRTGMQPLEGMPEVPSGAFDIIPLGIDAPDWAHTLNTNLTMVHCEVVKVRETHVKILEIVDELKPEVMAVVDGLQNNPMFKMLLGGKR